MRAPVSVIVPTRNEESNVRPCLRSVSFADEVFVVDSGSSDNACAIAEEMGAKVVQFRYEGGHPKKRNWALESLHLRNEWILILDADERVTPELAEEIAEKVANSDADGYYIPRRFMFTGRCVNAFARSSYDWRAVGARMAEAYHVALRGRNRRHGGSG